jgi:uncharacterized protein with PQ loop repeat
MKEKLNFYLQWSATVITILGALFTSLNIYPANVIAFNVGSVLWLIYAIRVKVSSLVAVNAGLLLIYVAGLIKASV